MSLIISAYQHFQYLQNNNCDTLWLLLQINTNLRVHYPVLNLTKTSSKLIGNFYLLILFFVMSS